MKRHKAVVKQLLTRKDVEVSSADDNEQTPLLIVGMKGDEAVVKLLLARSDVAINSRDQHGQTLLILLLQSLVSLRSVQFKIAHCLGHNVLN